MATMDHGPVLPLTAIAWTSNLSTCPKDFTLINITEDGANANFTRFSMRPSYYLCYSKATSGGMVVSDIRLIAEKDSIPHGYCFIAEHLEPKTTVSKKKRVCVRVVPVGSVDTAILDIKLTARSKMMLQHYTYVGEINNYVLWCRKGHFTSTTPQTKPRNVSLTSRRYSLELPSVPQPLKPSNPPQGSQVRLSHRRHSLPGQETREKTADGSIQGIPALDGVPFSLNPELDIQPKAITQLNYQLNTMTIKSLQDIENEYKYTFAVEYAAKRTRPLVQIS
ncbi:multivesicular body subunit 12A [Corythoichthys intestinalis]|uniref:multivesicular body subunit 12A n=1 Tax=Corythoichthys intestinalis TaxID=161448 RepID=UPI0025A52F86|nr:multivesicular body subunit 12A [Corythoichthys intestinalis]XP_061792044.1 multivesicular body subunit 12A-like [Nerophis lumbriciformis]